MGAYRVILHGTMDGQTVDTVTSWETVSASTQSEGDLVAQQVGNAWVSRILPYVSDHYVVTGASWYSPENTSLGGANSIGGSGALTAQALPAFVVARVILRTNLRGRSYQGRFGIPGITVNNLDATNTNQLAELARGEFQAQVQGLDTDVTQAVFCVISEVHNKVRRPFPVTTQVTSVSVSPFLGSRNTRKA